LSDDALERRIVEHLGERAKRPLKLKEIARGLAVGDDGYQALKATLARLTDEGAIYRIKGQRYALPEQINLVVGRLDGTRGGAGFVVPERRLPGPDIFVPSHRLAGARHGDRVVARTEHRRRSGNPEGQVIRVLERARTKIVGTLQHGKHFGFVRPDNPRLRFDVFVAGEHLQDAGEGQKVVATIDDWGDGTKSPEGRITEVLGDADTPGVDILSIIMGHGLDTEFPADVESAATEITVDLELEAGRRLDLRDRAAFTIDPADAKDFDDALSVRQLDDDLYEIGIHIADVSYYVAMNSDIDEEAYERATSIYLVDRVIPMLPERLSNDLCSLVPNKDRLTYSVIATVDGEANVRDYKIAETVIRPEVEEHKEILWELQTLRRLAKVLRNRRAERGSLDFDLPEAAVELDEDGFPININEKVRLDSMRLIEEFMLLANEIVARHASEHKIPFIYRVHERPSPEKVERIRRFAAVCGCLLTGSGSEIEPRHLAKLLSDVRGRPEEELINSVVLTSMMRASYQVENSGHFGLAAGHYGHFTSPIRRYPDLVAHRVLKRHEAGERWKDPEHRDTLVARLERTAEHASLRERVADDAERDSIDLKKVEFMERHIGDEFSGCISRVRSFGFFVRLDDYFVDGLVHVSGLDDDYYEFNEDHYALLGQNTGRRFRLADPVRVSVEAVNKDARQIDFALIERET
jgi:ribonuclease R